VNGDRIRTVSADQEVLPKLPLVAKTRPNLTKPSAFRILRVRTLYFASGVRSRGADDRQELLEVSLIERCGRKKTLVLHPNLLEQKSELFRILSAELLRMVVCDGERFGFNFAQVPDVDDWDKPAARWIRYDPLRHALTMAVHLLQGCQSVIARVNRFVFNSESTIKAKALD